MSSHRFRDGLSSFAPSGLGFLCAAFVCLCCAERSGGCDFGFSLSVSPEWAMFFHPVGLGSFGCHFRWCLRDQSRRLLVPEGRQNLAHRGIGGNAWQATRSPRGAAESWRYRGSEVSRRTTSDKITPKPNLDRISRRAFEAGREIRPRNSFFCDALPGSECTQ